MLLVMITGHPLADHDDNHWCIVSSPTSAIYTPNIIDLIVEKK